MHPYSAASLVLLLAASAHGQDNPKPPANHREFFGIDKIWDVHIVVSGGAWTGMQPTKKGYGRGSFPYAEARVRIADHDEIVLGLRFKGQSTYWKLPPGNLKRSFKLDFDRYVKGQKFLGLKKLSLNNNYYDTTQAREAISFKAYRDAAVPAARTAFARVYLTIAGRTEDDGKVEDEYLGLYTLVEQQDRGLLERQTGEKGALLKPEKEVLPYLGDRWNERYEKAYGLRTKMTPAAGQVVAVLARVYHDYRHGWYRDGAAADAQRNQRDFQTRLEKVLDVDEFLRYLAVTVLIGNGDSPLLFPHNYYLAIPDKSRRVLWLPWDLNNSIGGMGRWTGLRLEELSIYRPTDLPFVRRILEIPAYKARYTKILRELIQGPCSARQLSATYETAKETTARAIADEARRSAIVTQFEALSGGLGKKKAAARWGKKTPAAGWGKKKPSPDLQQFFRAREKSVLDQLAGRSQGVPLKGGKQASAKAKAGNRKKDIEAYLAEVEKTLEARVQAGELSAADAKAKLDYIKKQIAAKTRKK